VCVNVWVGRRCDHGSIGILKTPSSSYDDDRDLYSGLIRLHVLHHAVEEPIFGLGMLEELARHGYRISPGTLYPILHGLEKKGYLRSTTQRNGKSLRKLYRATAAGRDALESAKSKVRELFSELMEGE
jgi:PadR family transcriptional regulator PadR